MKISIWCTTHRSIPPIKYGGVQLINWITAECLVEAGHDVTVFANKDSKTKARLIPMPSSSGEKHEENLVNTFKDDLYDCGVLIDTSTFSYPGRMLPEIPYLVRTGGDCNRRYCMHWRRNIVFPSDDHFHWHSNGVCACSKRRIVKKGLKKYSDPPILRKPVGYWSYSKNPEDFDKFSEMEKTDCYLYMGSIEPIKGVHLAVEFAQKAGIHLYIYGPIKDKNYFESKIKPNLSNKINYMGELKSGGFEKWPHLATAKALVYPTDCHDADPNVPKEALMVKTPVIGLANGALPEIVQDGLTGVLDTTVDGMVARIGELDHIDPEECRKQVLKKFSVESFRDNLIEICKRVEDGEVWY